MVKERISLSVENKTIKQLGILVKNGDFSSRSSAVENILNVYFNNEKCCVVLAGGASENLFVKELNRFRPLIDIGGKTLIEDIVQKVINSGFSNIIVIGSKPVLSVIMNVLGDGSTFNAVIQYAEEKQPKDSANTLKLAEKFVKNTFLFVPCDHFFDFNLKKLEKVHKNNSYNITLAIYAGAGYTWECSSIVELEGTDIISYWESPRIAKTHLTSTMIGFCEPSVFDIIPEKKFSMQKNLFQMLLESKKLGGAVFSGNFVNLHAVKDVEIIKNIINIKK